MKRHIASLLLILVLLSSAVTATSCTAIGRLRGRQTASLPTETPIVVPPTATPTHTPTPTATPTNTPTQAPIPTATLLLPTPAPQSGDPLALALDEAGHFNLTVTQEDLNTYLGSQTPEQQGIKIEDVEVTFTAEEAIATFQATHAESGIRMGLTVRAVPRVADGKVFVEVLGFELDESVTGFARLIAEALIDGMLKQYATENGIPIPLEGVSLETVQLAPGSIHIVGSMAQ